MTLKEDMLEAENSVLRLIRPPTRSAQIRALKPQISMLRSAETERLLVFPSSGSCSKLQRSVNKKNVGDLVEYDIKWTRKLKNQLIAGRALDFDDERIIQSLYRPYVKNFTYNSWELNAGRDQRRLSLLDVGCGTGRFGSGRLM